MDDPDTIFTTFTLSPFDASNFQNNEINRHFFMKQFEYTFSAYGEGTIKNRDEYTYKYLGFYKNKTSNTYAYSSNGGNDTWLKFSNGDVIISVNISLNSSNEYFEGTPIEENLIVGHFVVIKKNAYKVVGFNNDKIMLSNNQDINGKEFDISTGKFTSELIEERKQKNQQKATILLGEPIQYDTNGNPINKELPKLGFFSKMKDGLSNFTKKKLFGRGKRTRRRRGKTTKRKRSKGSRRH